MNYSIKYLEEISGVKAHTIRIWELRYNLLRPKRTDTNIRVYDDAQLRKILNVTALLNAGYKISRIGEMTDEQINTSVKNHLGGNENTNNVFYKFSNDLIVSALNFDINAFENHFNSCVLKFGFGPTIEKVLYPTLKRVGLLWQSEEINPSQEHFFSNLVKQKLYSAIDGLPKPTDSSKKCLLFLPEEELHEIGLLYFNYLLMKSGIKTIYLGENVPLEHVKQAVKYTQPTHLILFMIKVTTPGRAKKYLSGLCRLFPSHKILVSGNPVFFEKLKARENLHFIDSPESAKKYFKITS